MRSSTAANPRTVRVEVFNQIARIIPGDVGGLFTSDLTYSAVGFEEGGAFGYTKRSHRETLCRYDADGNLVLPIGLVHLALDRLKAAGCHVIVEHHYQLDPRAKPDDWTLSAVRGSDGVFLNAVAREPRGLILARQHADIVRLIALICQLFPKARIMIVLNASRRVLREFRRRLQNGGAGPVHLLDHYGWPWEEGRLVCGLDAFDDSLRSCDRLFDIVVLADAVQAIARAHQRSLARLAQHRVYGFVSSGHPIGARTRLDLQALVGPFVYETPDPRGAEAAVVVHWGQPPWAPYIHKGTALERKRIYWHNAPRNDLLAAIAAGISAGDLKALWERGLLLPEDCAEALRGMAVTVLVESTEHGRELLRRLPGWTLTSAVPGAPGQGAAVNPWTLRPLHRTILTYRAASTLKVFNTDVLIAAAGEWPYLPDGFPPRSGSAREVLLIDMADCGDATARAATRRRLQSYDDRGWASVGAPRRGLDDGEAMSRRRRSRSRRSRPSRKMGRPAQPHSR